MKEIYLSGKNGGNKKTKVDDEDYKKYSTLKWWLSKQGYVVGRMDNPGRLVRLHRLIMNCPENLVVDHLNGDKLDNRKCNLRVCSTKENANNRHDIKGYTYDKEYKKYKVRYKGKWYGRYNTEEEAKEAYKLAKSGVEYSCRRRKYYMLPKHISKQFGKYVVGVQINNNRYRKVGIKTMEEAIKYRDNLYKTLEGKDKII